MTQLISRKSAKAIPQRSSQLSVTIAFSQRSLRLHDWTILCVTHSNPRLQTNLLTIGATYFLSLSGQERFMRLYVTRIGMRFMRLYCSFCVRCTIGDGLDFLFGYERLLIF